VLGYKIGHAVDALAGSTPVNRYREGLRWIYTELNNPHLARAREINPSIDHTFPAHARILPVRAARDRHGAVTETGRAPQSDLTV
jgi:hypothetical protein